MPCTDGSDFNTPIRLSEDEYHRLTACEASLCGIMYAMEKHGPLAVLERVDWRETGVTRQRFDAWWEEHKQKDAARRELELQQARQEKLRRKAIKKLTREEQLALGLAVEE
jgi:hypothetical protein